MVLAGVFCLFAALALVVCMMSASRTPVRQALLWAAFIGACSVGLAFAGFRRRIRLLIAVIFVQVGGELWLSSLGLGKAMSAISPSLADHAKLISRIQVEGTLAILMIVAGYVLVVAFIQKEGRRVFGSITEVRLAQEVHQALVPSFTRRIGDYEILGASVPSGQVGGDLVDLVGNDGYWMAYVADVSGHGVPAGMIMAMVKSAVRMGSPERTFPDLLSSLNRVLLSLVASNVFVTFSCVAGSSGPVLRFALAGHLPVLHYRRRHRVVEERSVSNLPLAVVPDTEFAMAEISCEPGDMLAILTDGLTEASDEAGLELGLEPLKAVCLESADAPLEQVMDRLRATSLERGKQTDDQTVLLVRRDSVTVAAAIK
jgi:sigma-B regulation protein RsbU (phosphoserine phosphatase)